MTTPTPPVNWDNYSRSHEATGFGQVFSTTEAIIGSNYNAHETDSDGVVIVSGGMDSVTLVHYMMTVHGAKPHLLSFDYGQRHKKELNYALKAAERLKLRWSLIDLSSITELISSSALTYGTDVPDGHYAEDNMALTVVPNRNMMMLSIAGAVAVNYNYRFVATGVHAGDHAQYPDCREPFIIAARDALMRANEGFIREDFELMAPFIKWSKNDIAEAAYDYEVPLHETWSCYKGGTYHCGRCGTCVERLEAINSVGRARSDWDKTIYDDPEFWKQAVAEFRNR